MTDKTAAAGTAAPKKLSLKEKYAQMTRVYTPPALLRMQAAHMPHAEVHVIPEAGHAANWEQPAVYNQRVIDFLRRHTK